MHHPLVILSLDAAVWAAFILLARTARNCSRKETP